MMTIEELLEKIGELTRAYESEHDECTLGVQVDFVEEECSFSWNGEHFTPVRFVLDDDNPNIRIN